LPVIEYDLKVLNYLSTTPR